ncbi:DUF6241 domain-containing protein [Peribacillus frigoritolerans]|jgi:hypothetical protein|uniref:DUF6241 domain-containing protein n=1 Tax=Peribacillus frigoritolerans TaxID=450367 RepID=UPI0007BEBB2B|nr:DUF6241 domain-containing protein [Peribacillus frigoritolerans]MBD8138517.1 hypothetical protein [Bacillus sp. CFBP 13597]QNK50345.1 hypothetical protein H7F28_09200 [Brevibacterium sp. PAMC23299]MCR8872278.1 DUF6241 domain-containing protein [Peribacillus frigoritolerans]MED3831942.1 DUF6241 domain-containing protein [Peribacillus frigoritolerans]MED3845696.1 DUF6241 domain-containing protein [Peribacillus frigoritolerans]
MNKFKWSMVGLITAAAVISVVMTIYQNAKNYEERRESRSTPVEILNKDDEEAEMEEQTSEIGGVQDETGLTQNSTQEEVMDVMHHMTHQKVIAEEKWGAVEMNSENINAVYDIVVDSDFMLKGDLLNIVSGWKEGNFDNVAQDHNYFWEYQNGTVGKATGILNTDEEAEFIDNNF